MTEAIQLGSRGKVEHVLNLRHVRDLDPVEDVEAFLDGVDLVAIEVRGSLLELREVFHQRRLRLDP